MKYHILEEVGGFFYLAPVGCTCSNHLCTVEQVNDIFFSGTLPKFFKFYVSKQTKN